MNKPADDVFSRDAKVLRVRGALAFTDATRPGAGVFADAAILIRDGKIEVLAMATVAGTHAAGFGDTIGRIVPGGAATWCCCATSASRVLFLRLRCRRSRRSCTLRVRGMSKP